jgi:hypothetical protein
VRLFANKYYHTSDADGHLSVCFEYACCCTLVLGVVVGITKLHFPVSLCMAVISHDDYISVLYRLCS